MPTDVISTIAATSTPTTPDFSSLQAWEDASPANLVTDDKRWIGQCLDQGTFTSGITIGGSTVDATRYKFLTTGAGASFKDKAGVRTNALNYNTAGGVTIQTAGVAITAGENYTHFEGLQVKRTGYSGANGFANSGNPTNLDINKCIIFCELNIGTSVDGKVKNCLLIAQGAGAVNCLIGQGHAHNCTCIGSGSGTCFISSYNNLHIENCAVFNFATFSSGTFRTGSNYNATDLASASGGANDLTSLTYANQFENTASDWRAKSTGDLHAGTPDATDAPDDISDQDRDDTTPWIGCWEVVSAAQGRRTGMLSGGAMRQDGIMSGGVI